MSIMALDQHSRLRSDARKAANACLIDELTLTLNLQPKCWLAAPVHLKARVMTCNRIAYLLYTLSTCSNDRSSFGVHPQVLYLSCSPPCPLNPLAIEKPIRCDFAQCAESSSVRVNTDPLEVNPPKDYEVA